MPITREELKPDVAYVTESSIIFNRGDVLTLHADDGTNMPYFKRVSDGVCHFEHLDNLSPYAEQPLAVGDRVITNDSKITGGVFHELPGVLTVLKETDGRYYKVLLDEGCRVTGYNKEVWVHDVVRENTSTTWQSREARKLRWDYKTLPKQVLAWFPENGFELKEDHYLHMSTKQYGLISYTESEEKGEKDVQTPGKFGRYLNRWYSDEMSEAQIKEVVELFNGLVLEVSFATTREDIKKVYDNGPGSCMGGKGAHEFKTDGIHPCEVYAGGDLAIAYMGPIDKPSARVLCRPDKKAYSTIYGNDSMAHALIALGYEQDSDLFEGSRLLRLENDNGRIIAPYVDGSVNQVDVHSDHLILTSNGEYETEEMHSTGGLLEGDDSALCGWCDERAGEDEVRYIPYVTDHVCDHCIETRFVYAYTSRNHQEHIPEDRATYVNSTGEYYADEVDLSNFDLVEVYSGEIIPIDEACYSEYEGNWYSSDDVIHVTTASGDDDYVHDSTDTVEDSVTGNTIIQSEATEYEDADGDTCYTLEEVPRISSPSEEEPEKDVGEWTERTEKEITKQEVA